MLCQASSQLKQWVRRNGENVQRYLCDRDIESDRLTSNMLQAELDVGHRLPGCCNHSCKFPLLHGCLCNDTKNDSVFSFAFSRQGLFNA